jgi:hypothetical protein
MNRIKFYEALYASCSDIVARRKSIVLPLLVIALGIALPLISMMIFEGPEFDDLNSSIVLIGIALAVGGGIWLLGRLVGTGEPYHTANRRFLETKTLSYDRSRRSEVLNAIGSGDINRLLAIPTCEVSALCVMITMLNDKSFAAAQAFEYAELEYRELCGVTIMKK